MVAQTPLLYKEYASLISRHFSLTQTQTLWNGTSKQFLINCLFYRIRYINQVYY